SLRAQPVRPDLSLPRLREERRRLRRDAPAASRSRRRGLGRGRDRPLPRRFFAGPRSLVPPGGSFRAVPDLALPALRAFCRARDLPADEEVLRKGGSRRGRGAGGDRPLLPGAAWLDRRRVEGRGGTDGPRGRARGEGPVLPLLEKREAGGPRRL